MINERDYTRYVICYDIPSDARRRKLIACLTSFGNRIQASVFEAMLNQALLNKLEWAIQGIILKSEDSVYLYPIRRGSEEFIKRLGSINYPIPKIDDFYIV